ncbi:hypothetical protein CA13_32760 [Planctomycetes bacterium CA13]|uniref:LemA family protein n=1 Tax=Novipirellula herctigrandis TaxID=2527986 RepID=A0A5C5Z5H5_9BACT|nr:hypothetical protein CA13_32760 [Planctomycetes bacterium CA13]
MLSTVILIVAAVPCLSLAAWFWTYRSIRKLEGRGNDVFRNLVESIAKEHLIIGHLTDSLPKDFEIQQQSRIKRKSQQANKALQDLCEKSSDVELAAAFSSVHGELWITTERLVKMITADQRIAELATVKSCLEGLKEAQERSYAAMQMYNHSAITMSAFGELTIPSLVRKLVHHSPEQWPLIDWTPDITT